MKNKHYKTITCGRCGKNQYRYKSALYCFDCQGKQTPMQSRARAKVARAIEKGDLPKLDGSILCVDCGDIAKNYDHRDYLKPLNVDPVCISCNSKRGTGKNKYHQEVENG